MVPPRARHRSQPRPKRRPHPGLERVEPTNRPGPPPDRSRRPRARSQQRSAWAERMGRTNPTSCSRPRRGASSRAEPRQNAPARPTATTASDPADRSSGRTTSAGDKPVADRAFSDGIEVGGRITRDETGALIVFARSKRGYQPFWSTSQPRSNISRSPDAATSPVPRGESAAPKTGSRRSSEATVAAWARSGRPRLPSVCPLTRHSLDGGSHVGVRPGCYGAVPLPAISENSDVMFSEMPGVIFAAAPRLVISR